MLTEGIFEKLTDHLKKRLPFVVYAKPDSDKLVGLFQQSLTLNKVKTFEEEGFIFSKFNSKTYLYIPVEESEVVVERFEPEFFELPVLADFKEYGAAKTDFERLVHQAVIRIIEGAFEKLVVSRKERVPLKHVDCSLMLKKILFFYPSAFTYCLYHPEVGLWMGATPEQLLQVDGNQIRTVALAGTQLFTEVHPVVWEQKEKEEQAYVTRFIQSAIRPYVDALEVSDPYTAKAAHLAHIKTDVEAILKDKQNKKNILNALHPTPAVCGLPKEKALAFLKKNEGYDRELYAGFLGEWNRDVARDLRGQSDLFVNLRCMKLHPDHAEIFVGCGITRDSEPEKEFIETVNKSLTMKKIIL